jgi:hypothetical protein
LKHKLWCRFEETFEHRKESHVSIFVKEENVIIDALRFLDEERRRWWGEDEEEKAEGERNRMEAKDLLLVLHPLCGDVDVNAVCL